MPAPTPSRSAIMRGISARRWCSSSARRGSFGRRIFRTGTPGRGTALVDTKNGKRALVINAIGRVFMTPFDDPFADHQSRTRSLPAARGGGCHRGRFPLRGDAAKSRAIGFFCDGRASLVVGTHTHVPTADHQILSGGTAYMTDAGMTGDYDSIIGMQKEEPLRRFMTAFPRGDSSRRTASRP